MPIKINYPIQTSFEVESKLAQVTQWAQGLDQLHAIIGVGISLAAPCDPIRKLEMVVVA